MTRSGCLLLLITTFFFIQGVVETEGAYSCVPFNRSDLISPCSAYDPSAYAYLDLNVTTLDAQLAYMRGWITALSSFVTEPNCNAWAVAWACQEPRVAVPRNIESMRSCAVDVFGEVVSPPTPVPTCRDMCDQYFRICKPVLDAAGLGAFFPDSFCDSYTNDGVSFQGQIIPCYNITPNPNATAPELNCPDYTVETPQSTCNPTCPSPEYSSSDVFDIGLMQQIVSWISFVATACLVISFMIYPNLREFPNRIILFLLISTMPLSLAFMLATFVGGNVGDVWCGDTEAFKSKHIGGSTSTDADIRSIASGGLCVFQAWLIVWGTLATGLWWLMLIGNTASLIYRSSHLMKPYHPVWLEPLYHIIGWGIPTILVIIPTAAGKMDYESTNVFCFIASADDQGWRIGCWFVPMGIIVFLGFIEILFASYFIITMGAKSGLRRLVIFRLSLSLFIILVTTTLFLAFLIFSSTELENNLFFIYQYLICLLSGNPETACRDSMYSNTSLSTSYQLGMAATFFLCALGFLLSCFTASASAFLATVKTSSPNITSRGTSSSRSAGSTGSATREVV